MLCISRVSGMPRCHAGGLRGSCGKSQSWARPGTQHRASSTASCCWLKHGRSKTSLDAVVKNDASMPSPPQETDGCIQIHFVERDVVMRASPGTLLCEVAEAAGIVVSYGCGNGQCGMCEMEVKKYACEGAAADGDAQGIVVRSCVTPVPRNIDMNTFWEVSELVDSIWGGDSYGS